MDGTAYDVRMLLAGRSSNDTGGGGGGGDGGGGSVPPVLRAGSVPHDWVVAPAAPKECLSATLLLAPSASGGTAGSTPSATAPTPTTAEVFAANAVHWPGLWSSGAALDLSGSTAQGPWQTQQDVAWPKRGALLRCLL